MARIMLKEVTLGFAQDLFKPTAIMGSTEEKYRCTAFVDKGSENEAAVNAAIRQVVAEKWGEKKADGIIESIRSNANKFCFKDGDKTDYDGAEGRMLLSLTNKEQPTLLTRTRGPAGQDQIFSGAVVNISADIYAYEFNNMKGVAGGVRGVQFVKDDGTRWGGGGTAKDDDFDNLGGVDGEDNPDEDFA